MSAVDLVNSRWIWKFHSKTRGECTVPTIPVTLGAAKTAPRAERLEEICAKVSLMLNALADACQTAAPPFEPVSKGRIPAAGRTRIGTATGGFASRLSTRPAAGLS